MYKYFVHYFSKNISFHNFWKYSDTSYLCKAKNSGFIMKTAVFFTLLLQICCKTIQ